MAPQPFHHQVTISSSGCWEWTGAKSQGYGYARLSGCGMRSVHRVSYELAKGEIPKGMVVMHRCDNPICCNPEHLFLGTQGDNLADASSKGRMRGQDQTHCVNGHEYTPENTYRRGTNGRDCRACIRARVARYQAKLRAA